MRRLSNEFRNGFHIANPSAIHATTPNCGCGNLLVLSARKMCASRRLAQQEKAQQECTADTVLQTVQSQIQSYMDNNDVAKLTGKGSSQYIQNTFVCERNWESTDAEGRAVYTITHNPESLSLQRVYKLLHAKTEQHAAPPPSTAATSRSDTCSVAYKQVAQQKTERGNWRLVGVLSSRASPKDQTATLCVGNVERINKIFLHQMPNGQYVEPTTGTLSFSVTQYDDGRILVEGLRVD
jgi:hypothetical protein